LFFVCTLILFKILFNASTSAAVPLAPCYYKISSVCCWIWSFDIPCIYIYIYICYCYCYDRFYCGFIKFAGGTVERLLALRYGCNCFRRTSTNATLSSLSSLSMGVSLLYYNNKLLLLTVRNMYMNRFQSNIDKFLLTFSQDSSACLYHFQECLEFEIGCHPRTRSWVVLLFCISHEKHLFYPIDRCSQIVATRTLAEFWLAFSQFLRVCAPKSWWDLH